MNLLNFRTFDSKREKFAKNKLLIGFRTTKTSCSLMSWNLWCNFGLILSNSNRVYWQKNCQSCWKTYLWVLKKFSFFSNFTFSWFYIEIKLILYFDWNGNTHIRRLLMTFFWKYMPLWKTITIINIYLLKNTSFNSFISNI